MTEYTRRVLEEVAAERDDQDAKWGLQRLADNDGDDDGTMLLGRSYAVWERILKHVCDSRRAQWLAGGDDTRNMTVATLEEVFECLAAAVAGDRVAFRKEAVQCAAMFTKWIEIHDYYDAVADYAAYTADPVTWIDANTVDGIRPHIPTDPDRSDRNRERDLLLARMEPDRLPPVVFKLSDLPPGVVDELLVDRPDAPADPFTGVRHSHDFDRLHGICRCGLSRSESDERPGS